MAAPVQTIVELPQLTAAQQSQLESLEKELRCLVCQNQTLAESSADVAQDLRNLVHKLVASGKSDSEIKTYLVERYSDFVLYKPPFKAKTAFLWLGPFALLGIGALTWGIIGRRQARMAEKKTPGLENTAPEAIERARREAQALLKK
ncbi:MAG: cytochrome c-type biogenesis protein [Burkholderiaceae bacterium]